MGWSESEPCCSKHPHHRQLQGVCPSCLRDRLSLLCADYSQRAVVAPSYSSSRSCSASTSAYVSPARRRHHRNVSEIMGSKSFVVRSVSNNGLKKSRSIAFVPRNLVGEVKNGKKQTTKKGFWSKLLRLNVKDKEALLHSSTVIES